MLTQTLRPGLLVNLSIRLTGNVRYDRTELEPEHITQAGTKVSRWETERVVEDAAEHERAWKIRSQARTAISKVCVATSFGLICPDTREAELADAVATARSMIAEFNSQARITAIEMYIIVGRVNPDDLEAVRAINSEVRSLLDDMTAGLRQLDVKAVRDAAARAKAMGRMLSPEAAERIQGAVKAARDLARQIVKAGEEAAVVVNHEAIKQIMDSRTAFLDLDGGAEIEAPNIAAPAIDLPPQDDSDEPPLPLPPPAPAARPELEI